MDCDGVLADFTSGWRMLINSLYPNKLPEGYIPSDWWYTGVLTKQEIDAGFAKLKELPNFWLGLLPLPGATEFDAWLEADGLLHDIYVVSSRAPSAGLSPSQQTRAWLELNLTYYEDVAGVLVVPSATAKRVVYEAAGFSHSLDDHPETVLECQKISGHNAFLLDQPWNRHYEVHNRAASVKEFFERIRD